MFECTNTILKITSQSRSSYVSLVNEIVIFTRQTDSLSTWDVYKQILHTPKFYNSPHKDCRLPSIHLLIISFNILLLLEPPVMAPIRVVGDEFCVPYYTDLVVKKKLKSIFSSTHYQVFDTNGTLMFKVDDGGGFSQHSNRYMRDAGGFPIVLMRNKVIKC